MSYESELKKAQALVDDWQAKATAIRGDLAELESSIGATVLDDPSAAEKVTAQAEAKRREIRTCEQAVSEARSRVRAVHRRHAEKEAESFDREAAARRREATRHQKKVDALLGQLRELDGCQYVPELGRAAGMDGNVYRVATEGPRRTRGTELDEEANDLEAQAKLVRRVMELGHRPKLEEGSDYFATLPPVTQAALEAGALG